MAPDFLPIGIKDNFFSLGGDSILAIKLVNQINKEFYTNISVLSIFQHNTVSNIFDYLRQNLQNTTQCQLVINSIPVANTKEQVLSFAQERLWFIDKYTEGTSAYNIPVFFEFCECFGCGGWICWILILIIL